MKIIQKVKRCYVSNDCIQIMVAYKNRLTILSPYGLNFSGSIDNGIAFNKYLEDERRNLFPYSNIPIHNKKILLNNYKVTNQILNFNTPYVFVRPEYIEENYILKDGEDAFIVRDIYLTNKENNISKWDMDLISDILENDKKHNNNYLNIFDYQGRIINKNEKLPTEDMFKEIIFNNLKDKIDSTKFDLEKLRKLSNNCIHKISDDEIQELYEKGYFNYFYKLSRKSFLNIRSYQYFDDKNSSFRLKNFKYYLSGIYKVSHTNIPINKYTLEDLKNIRFELKMSDPKINFSLNPSIKEEDIKKAKVLAKTLKDNR